MSITFEMIFICFENHVTGILLLSLKKCLKSYTPIKARMSIRIKCCNLHNDSQKSARKDVTHNMNFLVVYKVQGQMLQCFNSLGS